MTVERLICTACGAPIEPTGVAILKCPYCDTTLELEGAASGESDDDSDEEDEESGDGDGEEEEEEEAESDGPGAEPFDRGLALHENEDYAGAIAAYSEAITADPDMDGAWCGRGCAKQDSGDLDGAFDDYSKAIELGPENAEYFYNRATVYQAREDWDAALADYDRAIELDENDVDNWTGRASVKQEQEDLGGAIEDYSQAIEVDGENAEAWYGRGSVKYQQDDHAGAEVDLTNAIKLDPSHAGAHFNRGCVREEAGNAKGAIHDWRKYLELEPEAEDADEVRGWIAEAREKLSVPSAVDDVRRAFRQALAPPGPLVAILAAVIGSCGALVPGTNLLSALSSGALAVAGAGLILVYAYRTLAHAIAGRAELPDGPDWAEAREIVARVFVASVGAGLPFYALALADLWFTRFMPLYADPPSDVTLRLLATVLTAVGDVWALVLGPMALLLVAFFENGLMGFAYPAIVRSIAKTAVGYGELIGKLVLVFVAPLALLGLVPWLPDWGGLALGVAFVARLFLAGALVAAAILAGEFYQANKLALEWDERLTGGAA